MAKKYQILSFGEALIDFTPTSDGSYMPNPGGAPFNFAACTAKYGCKTAFVGKLGKDAFGKLISLTAEKLGVDVSGVVWDGKRVTTHAFITLDDNGDRDFVFCRDHGADTAISVDELPLGMIADTKLFHFGGLSLTHSGLKETCLAALEHARKNGAFVSFDPNYRALLWESEADFVAACKAVLDKVDILKVSIEEAFMLTGEDCEGKSLNALRKQVPVVLLTKGAKGATCVIGNETMALPATPAKAVDTTGAGDIFFGTFLAMMLSEGYTPGSLDKEAAKRFGAKACLYAAKSTEKYGAIPSIPNFSQQN